MTNWQAVQSTISRVPLHSLRARWTDTSQNIDADVAHRAPDRWTVLTHSSAGDVSDATGIISDGRTVHVLENGTAVARLELDETMGREPPVSNHLQRMLRRQRTAALDSLGTSDTAHRVRFSGRSAWVVPRRDAAAASVVIDADTGILLSMSWNDDVAEFSDVEINSEIRDEVFQWSGPINLSRRPGMVYVAQEWLSDPGTTIGVVDEAEWREAAVTAPRFGAHWEISVMGRPVCAVPGPRDADAATVVEWARARARVVVVRVGAEGKPLQHYSAGEEQPRSGPLPLWPGP